MKANKEKIQHLLSNQEGTKLDFKRTLDIFKYPNPYDQSCWAELIKDIISLFNGNIGTLGDYGYLIIGADDKLENGNRNLYQLEPHLENLTAPKLMEQLHNFVKQRIYDISVEQLEIRGTKILVIEMPPLPYLLELGKDLIKSDFKFQDNKHTVLTTKVMFKTNSVIVRNNESIALADVNQIIALKAEKEKNIGSTLYKAFELLSFYDRALFYAPYDDENVFEMYNAISEVRVYLQKNLYTIAGYQDTYDQFKRIINTMFETEKAVDRINLNIRKISSKLVGGKSFFELVDHITLREQIPNQDYTEAAKAMFHIRFEIEKEVIEIRRKLLVSFA